MGSPVDSDELIMSDSEHYEKVTLGGGEGGKDIGGPLGIRRPCLNLSVSTRCCQRTWRVNAPRTSARAASRTRSWSLCSPSVGLRREPAELDAVVQAFVLEIHEPLKDRGIVLHLQGLADLRQVGHSALRIDRASAARASFSRSISLGSHWVRPRAMGVIRLPSRSVTNNDA